jgi:hypothetical protein
MFCGKKLARATIIETMEVKYFKVKHKVLKNSLHSQIRSDFQTISLKMSDKSLEIFQ